MTQLVVDGFATYGTNAVQGWPTVNSALIAGAYADVGGNVYGVSTLPWLLSDTTLFLRVNSGAGGGARRVLPAAYDEVIIAFRCALDGLPTANNARGLVGVSNGSNQYIFNIIVQSTGAIAVRGTSGNAVASTQGPVIVSRSAQHVECRFKSSTGVVQVYVDGVKVLDATGLVPEYTGTIAQFALGTGFNFNATVEAYITDVIVRNTLGSYNNTIMGDRRVATVMVNADDPAYQGWTPRPIQRFGSGVLENLDPYPQGVVWMGTTSATNLGNGDFTIEGNFRFGQLPLNNARAVLFSKWSPSSNNMSYALYKSGPNLNGGNLVFEISTDGTGATASKLFQWPWAPVVGRWYHVAVSRASGVLRVFIDGVMQGTAITDANTYYAAATQTTIMGGYDNGAVTNWRLFGWSDEFRMTVGASRYSSNFTPPTDKFPRGSVSDPLWSNVQWLSGWDTGLLDESSAARALSAYGNQQRPQVSTPNDGGAAYRTLNKRGAPFDYNFIEAALIPATSLYTLSAQPAVNDTTRVGTKDGTNAATYKFVTTLAAAYDVLIGATASATMDNLVAAINAGSGAGTVYGTGTVANFDVSATRMPTIQLMATANIAGAIGNSVVTSATGAAGTWTGATLAGGADIPPYSQFRFERPPLRTTVLDSITIVNRAWKTDSGPASVQAAFVGPAGAVANGAARPVSTTPTLYFDTFEVDPDTNAPLTPTSVLSGMVRVNRTL